jgi:hypothetical protein
MSEPRGRPNGQRTAGDKVRGLIAGLTHDEAYKLAQVAGLRAVVLDQLDSEYPDPERRADADTLRALTALLRQANQARDVIGTAMKEERKKDD